MPSTKAGGRLAVVADEALPVKLPVTLPLKLAVIVPAAKLPEASRATIALVVLATVAVVALLLTLPALLIVASLLSAIVALVAISASTIVALAIAADVTASFAILPVVTALAAILAVVIGAVFNMIAAHRAIRINGRTALKCWVGIAATKITAGGAARRLTVSRFCSSRLGCDGRRSSISSGQCRQLVKTAEYLLKTAFFRSNYYVVI